MASYEVVFPGNKRVDVRFGNFEIKTDQSRKSGGDETAPEPFALFLSSLAACAGIYAKSFCDTRDIDARDMKITMEAFSRPKQSRLDEIRMTLHVTEAFPEKYHAAILKAMNGCAVKNQLHPDIRFSSGVQPAV